MTCPRVLTKAEMLEILQEGGTLCVDRRDAPELSELLEWQEQGLVTSKLTVVEPQYSRLEFRWVESQPPSSKGVTT